MKSKNNILKKPCKIILITLMLFLICNNFVMAALNTKEESETGGISEFLGKVTGYTMTGAFGGLSTLITIISGILYVLMNLLFVTGGAGWPMPDNIIYNKLPLLDANFINPNPCSSTPLHVLQGITQNIYSSFVIIAVAVFVVAAMIIGIKLAISTLATEKAQYKKAIMAWVSGIILLLTMKWIMAGIFLINEEVVAKISTVAATSIEFKIQLLDFVPVVGSMLGTIENWLGFEGTPVYGYGGFYLYYLTQGWGGNIVGSIISLIVIGQIIALIVVYIKRVFYCMLLGLIAPLIIATDTISKSLSGKSTILTNWFKEFVLIVFMQSFHAFFLVAILLMISEITREMDRNLMSGIISLVLTQGLIKFEKTFKKLFGIGDSMLGDIKGGAAKALGALHGATTAAKAVGDNTSKYKDASKKKKAAIIQRDKLKEGIGADKANQAKRLFAAAKIEDEKSPTQRGLIEFAEGTEGPNKDFIEPSESAKLREKGKKLKEESETLGYEWGDKDYKDIEDFGNQGGNSERNQGGGSGENQDRVVAAINNLANVMSTESKEEKLKQLDEVIAESTSAMSSARFAQIMAPANLVAGAGIGLGFGQDLKESIQSRRICHSFAR